MNSKVFELIEKEADRQNNAIELIASENFVSQNILKAMGSCLTNKYAEGLPGKRYYGGCQFIDEIETYCIEKWKEVFNTDYHVNVQPHSGSQANFAAYFAVLNIGDTILSMDLKQGGHLTHGSKVSFSGRYYNVIHYGLDESGYIDYKDLESKIIEYRPKLVLAGASAYPREIKFDLIKSIIDSTSVSIGYTPYFMVDMAHIAGLVAAGEHITPFGYADIITTTTHKTLRGPRGGLIFCKEELHKKVDSAVFPGSQGGPLEHIIAAKAICAEEACTKEYKTYIKQVVKNAKAFADEFIKLGYNVITNGTDNHLLLLDFSVKYPELTGKAVQEKLDEYFITTNKNMIPNDTKSPNNTSGLRLGTAAMTTKGWVEEDFIKCADNIHNIISSELV